MSNYKFHRFDAQHSASHIQYNVSVTSVSIAHRSSWNHQRTPSLILTKHFLSFCAFSALWPLVNKSLTMNSLIIWIHQISGYGADRKWIESECLHLSKFEIAKVPLRKAAIYMRNTSSTISGPRCLLSFPTRSSSHWILETFILEF